MGEIPVGCNENMQKHTVIQTSIQKTEDGTKMYARLWYEKVCSTESGTQMYAKHRRGLKKQKCAKQEWK